MVVCPYGFHCVVLDPALCRQAAVLYSLVHWCVLYTLLLLFRGDVCTGLAPSLAAPYAAVMG